MIALEWLRQPGVPHRGERLAAALEAGTGRVAGACKDHAFTAASLLPHADHRRAAGWKPHRSAGMIALFAGHISNARTLAAELKQPVPSASDPQGLARLYCAAVAAWGSAADLRIIGEYAAIVLDETRGTLRLARSPLRGPPLQYHVTPERVVAANIPRALFACGVEPRLDEQRLVDNALFNWSNEERGWYEGVRRVPLGCTVVIDRTRVVQHRFHDLHALPPVRRNRVEDYVEEAHALLAEGTRAALDGFDRPGIMLSGGLDSPQVAHKALGVLPAEQRLKAFSFVVEAGWDGIEYPTLFGNERPYIEAFAAMHPQIEPHYFDNREAGFDTALEQVFFFTGSAPFGLTNLGVFHSLWAAARRERCDVVLLADYGNRTLSSAGSWGYAEYFRTLRWDQLFKALRSRPGDDRPLWRRFASLALLGQLPDRPWLALQRLFGRADRMALSSPLRGDVARASGAAARLEDARLGVIRPSFSRSFERRVMQEGGYGEGSEILFAFEQIYGVTHRDPSAYRPFAEFCLGLPTDLFLRDGQERWLAREMARGIMPEVQRLEPREGRHNADWHLKMTRRLDELKAQVERLADDPRISTLIDIDRMRAALADWPDRSPTDESERILREVTLTRGIAMARLIAYAEGRNI